MSWTWTADLLQRRCRAAVVTDGDDGVHRRDASRYYKD